VKPGKPKKLDTAKQNIAGFLRTQGKKVYGYKEFMALFSAWKDEGELAQGTSFKFFVNELIEAEILEFVDIKLPYLACKRFGWSKPTTYEYAQSIHQSGYFSHFSALHLNGLTEQLPKRIYFNVEQKLKSSGGELTQAGINRAFANSCRVSSNVAAIFDREVCVLNGQNTDRLGVTLVNNTEGEQLYVTNLERTLIDIAVRPIYSGGVQEVAKAYEIAAKDVSLNRLSAYLRKFNFTYPYHQPIGFYLERTGKFSAKQLELFREAGLNYDFYLTHRMKDKEYNSAWRLYVPVGL
jgi:predicted transcriptional regulator of viral defense system